MHLHSAISYLIRKSKTKGKISVFLKTSNPIGTETEQPLSSNKRNLVHLRIMLQERRQDFLKGMGGGRPRAKARLLQEFHFSSDFIHFVLKISEKLQRNILLGKRFFVFWRRGGGLAWADTRPSHTGLRVHFCSAGVINMLPANEALLECNVKLNLRLCWILYDPITKFYWIPVCKVKRSHLEIVIA